MTRSRTMIGRAAGSLRYAGVVAVWLALLTVRPTLAMTVLRQRRADSPLPGWVRRTVAV